MWISNPEKIIKINDFLKQSNELVDIQKQFEAMELKVKEIENEPSFKIIGPLEVYLGH